MADTERWSERPYEGPLGTFSSDLLMSRDGEVPLKVISRGLCPLCGHDTRGEQWLVADVAGLVETADDEATLQTLEMRIERERQRGTFAVPEPEVIHQEMACACAGEHSGAPSGRRGCGAYWTLVLELDSDEPQ